MYVSKVAINLLIRDMDRTDKKLEWIMQMDGRALWQAAVSFFFTAQIPQFLPKALSWKMPHWLLFSHDRHLRIHPIKLCHLLNTRLFYVICTQRYVFLTIFDLCVSIYFKTIFYDFNWDIVEVRNLSVSGI